MNVCHCSYSSVFCCPRSFLQGADALVSASSLRQHSSVLLLTRNVDVDLQKYMKSMFDEYLWTNNVESHLLGSSKYSRQTRWCSRTIQIILLFYNFRQTDISKSPMMSKTTNWTHGGGGEVRGSPLAREILKWQPWSRSTDVFSLTRGIEEY